MTEVRARARLHADRAGDPLDSLVNLFDLAIVLAVAFLLVALTALQSGSSAPSGGRTRTVPTAAPHLPTTTSAPVQGRGAPVGTVYRLQDGSLVYVLATPSATTPSPGVPTGSPPP